MTRMLFVEDDEDLRDAVVETINSQRRLTAEATSHASEAYQKIHEAFEAGKPYGAVIIDCSTDRPSAGEPSLSSLVKQYFPMIRRIGFTDSQLSRGDYEAQGQFYDQIFRKGTQWEQLVQYLKNI